MASPSGSLTIRYWWQSNTQRGTRASISNSCLNGGFVIGAGLRLLPCSSVFGRWTTLAARMVCLAAFRLGAGRLPGTAFRKDLNPFDNLLQPLPKVQADFGLGKPSSTTIRSGGTVSISCRLLSYSTSTCSHSPYRQTYRRVPYVPARIWASEGDTAAGPANGDTAPGAARSFSHPGPSIHRAQLTSSRGRGRTMCRLTPQRRDLLG